MHHERAIAGRREASPGTALRSNWNAPIVLITIRPGPLSCSCDRAALFSASPPTMAQARRRKTTAHAVGPLILPAALRDEQKKVLGACGAPGAYGMREVSALTVRTATVVKARVHTA